MQRMQLKERQKPAKIQSIAYITVSKKYLGCGVHYFLISETPFKRIQFSKDYALRIKIP